MKVTYNDNSLTLPEGTTTEAAREALVGIYPEIANATAEVTSEGIEFKVQAGKKGSDLLKVVYGDNTISLPIDTTIENAREALKGIYPEIANATAELDGDTLTFTVQAGKKGR